MLRPEVGYLVSLAYHEDWKQGEPARLAVFKINKNLNKPWD